MDRPAGRDTGRFSKLEKELEFSLERGGTVQKVEFTRIYFFGWKHIPLLRALPCTKQNRTDTSLSSSEQEGECGVNSS